VHRFVYSGVFLVCWAPFFTINIINAVCIRQSQTVCATAAVAVVDHHVDAERPQSGAAAASPSSCPQEESEDTCRVNPVVMSSFVWLGYINSALNPVIYTIFNVEFRRAFDRLLRRLCTVLTCRCWDRCDAAAAAASNSSLLRTGSSLKG
jgi:dopamine receptor D2